MPAMIDRRSLLFLSAGALLGLAPRAGRAAIMSHITAYTFSFTGLDGGDIRLAAYAGRPILVVNTASLCGYTPQYAGLQQLWTRYRDKGLLVLGVPSNDFGGQEPGGAAEIGQDGPRRISRHLPTHRKGRGEGQGCPPVLPLGGAGAPAGRPALEFP